MVSLWLPRFATDRWQRSHAQSRQRQRQGQSLSISGKLSEGTPLALVTAERGQLSLAAVNAAAQGAGLTPGLPLAEARALLPGLATAPHEPEADAKAIAGLAAWCGRYSPWTAPCSTAEGQGQGPGGGAGVLLDVSGCCHLFGGEAALLEDLQARLTDLGYTIRVAMADTIGAAWAMARFAASPAHPCVVVMPGSQRAAIACLPPSALRLPDATVEVMDRLGLRRVEDLYALSPGVLAPRFGAMTVRRLAQALGEEAEALSPRRPPPAHLLRRIFAEPISDPEDIARALDDLLPRLCRELALAGRGARRLDLTAYRSDGTFQGLSVGTSRASREARHLRRLFTEKLSGIDPGFGIEVMTLAATRSDPLGARQMNFPAPVPTQQQKDGKEDAPAAIFPAQPVNSTGGAPNGAEDIPDLVDRLGSRLGLAAVRHPSPRESHLPERAFVLAPVGGEEGEEKPDDGWQKTPHPSLRPLRLLPRPEPVEAVSLLPDHPPARFRWRRVLHEVVQAEGPERLLGEWWQINPLEGDAEPRDYFRVEDADGRRYWLYRSAGNWFLHGLFG
ncbi:Y-family DNA polymerase [Pelagibius litoralis]|uniref:Y-family DNA polymerase n=1 Tax=Pelagibius litoralis TaxID=374515 RepID=UPI002AC31317|nr:DNA polymerase Y family protein [Pelagibius litoralis]